MALYPTDDVPLILNPAFLWLHHQNLQIFSNIELAALMRTALQILYHGITLALTLAFLQVFTECCGSQLFFCILKVYGRIFKNWHWHGLALEDGRHLNSVLTLCPLVFFIIIGNYFIISYHNYHKRIKE